MLRDVVLVHGLWVPGLLMAPLGRRLEKAGFRCRSFSYPGRSRPLAAHAERLARFAREAGPAHFVAHSLGGVVTLEALGAEPSLEVGKVVLLGTPAQGSLAGRRFAQHAAGRWLMGEAAATWREGRGVRWTRPEPLGVIAGTQPFGLGHLVSRLPGPGDGVVQVEETAVEGMRERVLLPVSHSLMLVSARVAENVAEFLAHGRFLPQRA
jgi:pimeloyl-ACP methyl ester carboxylesterase